MNLALDHVFVLCSAGAPEADALVRLGLAEGPPNAHPGQGTACRRIFFAGAYLELLWVDDAREARREPARRLELWERWSQREAGACPFGIALRPGAERSNAALPFATWTYRPSYLPADVSVDVADTPLAEPLLFCIRDRPARPGRDPVSHKPPLRDITDVLIGMPGSPARSRAAQALEATGLVRFTESEHPLMTLTFDHGRRGADASLRPDLPLALRW